MKKLTLDVETLRVSSFEVNADSEQVGTVAANELTPLCTHNTVSCDGTCVRTCDTCTPC